MDVSVIIPVYNVEQYLDQCLLGAEANDSTSIEIIALNDGSTDGSLEILRAHAARDPRVRVIDKPNEGYGASVNRGIELASGSYIAILEPDDYVLPHMYDTLIELARSYGNPDVVKSAYWRIQDPDSPQELRVHCTYYRRIKPQRQPFTLDACPRLIMHQPSIWSALYRKDFLDERGIRFVEAPGAGWVDNPFLIETLAQASSIVYTDESFYSYRDRRPGSSTCGDTTDIALTRWNDMRDILDRLQIHDTGIEAALNRVGFRHIGIAISRCALDDPELRDRIIGAMKRMDPDVVAGMDSISKRAKERYFALTGFDPRPVSQLPYLRYLAREFAYTARVNGVRYALSRTGVLRGRGGSA